MNFSVQVDLLSAWQVRAGDDCTAIATDEALMMAGTNVSVHFYLITLVDQKVLPNCQALQHHILREGRVRAPRHDGPNQPRFSRL